MNTNDVAMTWAASSRSSSLSPPPSSLPDQFDELPTTSQPFGNSSENFREPESDHDLSLEPISLSTDVGDEMVTTRGQKRAQELANAENSAPTDNTTQTAPTLTTAGSNRNTPPKKSSPPKTSGKGVIKQPLPKAKKKWTAEKLLTDHKSPLAKADIRSLLSKPEAWDILTEDEKSEILALMPPIFPVLDADTDKARPDMALLASDDNFRHDCAVYAENLGDGKHDPQWLDEAWAAHDQRRAGAFDDYFKHKFEEDWQTKVPEEDEAPQDEAGEKLDEDANVLIDKVDNEEGEGGVPRVKDKSPKPQVANGSKSTYKANTKRARIENEEDEDTDE